MSLVLYKGVDFRRRVTITDLQTGSRANLDGRVVKLQLRRRVGEAALIEVTASPLAQSGDTLGQADVQIDAAASAILEAPASHYICVLVDDQVAMAPTKLPVRAL